MSESSDSAQQAQKTFQTCIKVRGMSSVKTSSLGDTLWFGDKECGMNYE